MNPLFILSALVHLLILSKAPLRFRAFELQATQLLRNFFASTANKCTKHKNCIKKKNKALANLNELNEGENNIEHSLLAFPLCPALPLITKTLFSKINYL